jgi:hypothetical protein
MQSVWMIRQGKKLHDSTFDIRSYFELMFMLLPRAMASVSTVGNSQVSGGG